MRALSLYCACVLGLSLSIPGLACLDRQALQQLNQQEIAYLNARIPPAFADALDDGLIQSEMQVENAQPCTVRWQLTLPQADIDAAQQLLAAQPARQIMLSAQGYQLPAQPEQHASFVYELASGQVAKADTLQTAALGKLRASVELMYAMLTQARASLDSSTVAPWTAAQRAQATAHCAQNNRGMPEASCQCVTDKFAATIGFRQWRYYTYLLSNPYAYASGEGAAIKQLDKQHQQACQAASAPNQ